MMSSSVLKDAHDLCEKLINDIEDNKRKLSEVTYEASKLAMLMNHTEYKSIFLYEVRGYPSTPNGLNSGVWKLARKAGRVFEERLFGLIGKIQERARIFSIVDIENELDFARKRYKALETIEIPAITSGSDFYSSAYSRYKDEMQKINTEIKNNTEKLVHRKTFVYHYLISVYNELKYSSVSHDVFDRIRSRVDDELNRIAPQAVKKFVSAYKNLHSTDIEDWSNAVHSCRRILQEVADVLYPARSTAEVEENCKPKRVKLGATNYVNRLIAFVEENSDSQRYSEIVGSHLSYLGNRIDSIFKATQKGSHKEITTRQEADRYVIYTYLLIGDIIQLKRKKKLGV